MYIVGIFISHGVQNKNDGRKEGIHNMRSKVNQTGMGVLGEMGKGDQCIWKAETSIS